ncbi:MAG: hypothetical protein HYV07_30920 [Deltaproteobacteria bacterium]|nr:hypothetical protein [Deltaproteobacteria bacterium]
MSRFIKALAKVGLVELEAGERSPSLEIADTRADDAEIDLLLHEKLPEPAPERRPAPRPTSGRSPVPGTPLESAPAADSGSDRPFPEIYADAGIPASPFPAEKLLKVLAGLAALDAGTRKAAILAMDAADDVWSIEDPIIDARRKAMALAEAKQQALAQAEAAEREAREEIEARERYQADATAEIRKQIAELEAMLEKEITKVAEEKSAIAQKAAAAKDAAARETVRIDREIARLRAIETTFASPEPRGPAATGG